jgi:hypothetical protein
MAVGQMGRSISVPLALGVLAAGLAGCSSSHDTTAEWFLGRFTPGTSAAQVVVAHSACEHYGHTDYSGDASAIHATIIYKAASGRCTTQLEVSDLTLNLPHPTQRLDGGCDPKELGTIGTVCLFLQSHWSGRPISS